MGSCFSVRIKAEYPVQEGKGISPSVPRSQAQILQSSNLKSFGFNELKTATRNFRPDSVLGEGGFGCVFKGWIDEKTFSAAKPGTGMVIAVKRLNQLGLQGHQEWIRMSIDFWSMSLCLEEAWKIIYLEVALGAAKGLSYLHSPKARVIYRDFKSSNILIVTNYNAKLSDFGLAKDGPVDGKTHVSTRVMGTYGYAAPEYSATGHLTSKSDVYSFGVVMVEILTGQRVLDKNRPSGEQNLILWAKPYLTSKRRILEVMDRRIKGQYALGVAARAGAMAVKCVSVDPRNRPNMCEVVRTLEHLQDS